MEIIKNEEAQFMLLAGFIIALGLVVTSVLLSNIIFQGNMAGEAGADPSKYEIVNMMQITGDEMKSAYRNATALGGSNTQKINNFSKQMQNFSDSLSKIYALRGGGVKASNDTRNWNNYRYANYTKNGTASGAANWTVIENVQSVSVFELRNVNGSNFEIDVNDKNTGALLWSMWLNGICGVSSCVIGVFDNKGPNKTYTPGGGGGGSGQYINLLSDAPDKYNFTVGSNGAKITFINGDDASGTFFINGTASGRNFTRARDFILNATVTLSTSRMRVNITIPVSVPW